MKSIKPGRATSAMGALGSVIGIAFGIGWTVIAFSITRNSPIPIVGTIFPLFGVLFIIVGVVNLALSLRNTVASDRHSIIDIVDANEELDPLNEIFGRSGEPSRQSAKSVETRLNELEGLRTNGTISQDEYQATRMRILGDI